LFVLGLATIIPVAIALAVRGLYSRTYNRLKILAGILVSIAFIIAVDYAMNNILKPHQQHRIYVTLVLEDDPQGVGYNVNQSKIAIGSGGFSGKGFLDTTRIASSHPELWRDICILNRENLLEAIEVFQQNLKRVSQYLSAHDSEALEEDFKRARKLREGIGKN